MQKNYEEKHWDDDYIIQDISFLCWEEEKTTRQGLRGDIKETVNV